MRLSEDHTPGRRFQIQKMKQVHILVSFFHIFPVDDVTHVHLDRFELFRTAARQLPFHSMIQVKIGKKTKTSYE